MMAQQNLQQCHGTQPMSWLLLLAGWFLAAIVVACLLSLSSVKCFSL